MTEAWRGVDDLVGVDEGVVYGEGLYGLQGDPAGLKPCAGRLAGRAVVHLAGLQVAQRVEQPALAQPCAHRLAELLALPVRRGGEGADEHGEERGGLEPVGEPVDLRLEPGRVDLLREEAGQARAKA